MNTDTTAPDSEQHQLFGGHGLPLGSVDERPGSRRV